MIIYGLYDGRKTPLEIRYIGMTQGPIGNRLASHRFSSRKPKYPVHKWIKSIGVENVCYVILSDDAASVEELSEQERSWIAMGKLDGLNLLNVASGGRRSFLTEDGLKQLKLKCGRSGKENPFWGKHHSEAQRQRWSESRKGVQSGLDNPFWGKRHSLETREKMSKSHLGQKRTPEHRKAISAASMGEKNQSAKITENDVREIRRSYSNKEATQAQLAKRFGLTQAMVSRIVRRTSWSHIV